MVNKYKPGDIAYIIESKHLIQEVKVINKSGGFCTVRFTDGVGGLKLRESKLFPSEREAQNALPWDGIRKWHPD